MVRQTGNNKNTTGQSMGVSCHDRSKRTQTPIPEPTAEVTSTTPPTIEVVPEKVTVVSNLIYLELKINIK